MSTGTEASVSHVRKDVFINQLLFSSESGFSASKIIRHSKGLKETNLCIKVLGRSFEKGNTRQQKENIRFSKFFEINCFTATIETKLFLIC